MPCFCRRYVSVQKHKKTVSCCYLGSMLVWSFFFFRVGGWGRQEDLFVLKICFLLGKNHGFDDGFSHTQELIEVDGYLFVVCEDFRQLRWCLKCLKRKGPRKINQPKKTVKAGFPKFSQMHEWNKKTVHDDLDKLKISSPNKPLTYPFIHKYPGTFWKKSPKTWIVWPFWGVASLHQFGRS